MSSENMLPGLLLIEFPAVEVARFYFWKIGGSTLRSHHEMILLAMSIYNLKPVALNEYQCSFWLYLEFFHQLLFLDTINSQWR